MPVLSKNVLLHGREGPPAERIRLHAGLLRMDFEPDNAFLRYIRLGDREVIRGIYAAVRDEHWRTILPRVSNLDVESRPDSFRLSFDVECHERDVHFAWRGTITSSADEGVTFAMDGVARSTFLRNRIGICVLHPIAECAGQPCVVEKDDGSIEQGEFPHYIKPHQPFTDMRAITHEVRPGIQAEVRFDGDVFEMEDQRNWTDASFKTYSGPLSRPIPVEVAEGTRIAQSVTVRLHGQVPAQLPAAPADADEVVFTVSREPPIPLPRIGLGVASHGQPLSPIEIERLRALNLAHLRIDLHLAEPTYRDDLQRAAAEAAALGVPLEVALFLTDEADEQLRGLGSELDKAECGVAHFLICHEAEQCTDERWVSLARPHLFDWQGDALRMGAGTNANFTELNRGRLPVREYCNVAFYSVNPQVHTFDSASMVETVETQAWTLRSAQKLIGGRRVVVSPVTLKRRSTTHLTEAELQPDPEQLPTTVDVRQMSLFGAAWTLGSIKYLAEGGAASVTYYETTGWRGVMETEAGSPLPGAFPSIPGAVFPMYHVFADVRQYADEYFPHVGPFGPPTVIGCTSSAPLRVDGMALAQERWRRPAWTRSSGTTSRRCVLLANMSPEPQSVRVVKHGLGRSVLVRRIDEETAEYAMREPEAFRAEPGEVVNAFGNELALSLRPYAYVRIDAERSRRRRGPSPRRIRGHLRAPSQTGEIPMTGKATREIVEQWGIFELELPAVVEGNPFTDVGLTATFTYGHRQVRVDGFYDGDDTFRVRFSPDVQGEWQYATHSNCPDLDGKTGAFVCGLSGPDDHGPVKVEDTVHFAYADGTPYYQIGTTCYAWAHQGDELEEQTLETLKTAPFNKIRMCVFPKHYSYSRNEPEYFAFERGDDGEWDFTRFEPGFWRHFEKRVGQLMELGIEADLILFHPYDRWGFATMDAESDDRYLRYIVARLAAYRNVWWSLANEYDLMREKSLADWDRFFRIIQESDPYQRLRSVHNCRQFYDYGKPWVTHCSIQSSAVNKTREWRDSYRKPVVIDECRYEGNIEQGWGNISAREMVHRFWLGTVGGGYVGHGETYLHPEDILWWSKGGVLHGESPARIAFLLEILEGGPAKGFDPLNWRMRTPCVGKGDEYCLFYFPDSQPGEFTFNAPEGNRYRVELIDTWEMTIAPVEGIYSGSFKLSMPGKTRMAVRMVKVEGQAAPGVQGGLEWQSQPWASS